MLHLFHHSSGVFYRKKTFCSQNSNLNYFEVPQNIHKLSTVSVYQKGLILTNLLWLSFYLLDGFQQAVHLEGKKIFGIVIVLSHMLFITRYVFTYLLRMMALFPHISLLRCTGLFEHRWWRNQNHCMSKVPVYLVQLDRVPLYQDRQWFAGKNWCRRLKFII